MTRNWRKSNMTGANSLETQIPARSPAFLSHRMNNALVDFYRCPEALVPLHLPGVLPRQSGKLGYLLDSGNPKM